MGLIATRRAKESQPAGDLSARLSAVMRRSAAPRAEEAEGLGLDPKLQAVGVLDDALAVIAEVSTLVREAAGHVIGAAGEAEEGPRALLAERYDDHRRRIDERQGELTEGAAHLHSIGATALDVPLRGATYAIAPFPLDTSKTGLDLPPPEDGFATHQEVADTLRRVELALERLSRVRAIYLADRAFLVGGR